MLKVAKEPYDSIRFDSMIEHITLFGKVFPLVALFPAKNPWALMLIGSKLECIAEDMLKVP